MEKITLVLVSLDGEKIYVKSVPSEIFYNYDLICHEGKYYSWHYCLASDNIHHFREMKVFSVPSEKETEQISAGQMDHDDDNLIAELNKKDYWFF